jgi:hypothetical protein
MENLTLAMVVTVAAVFILLARPLDQACDSRQECSSMRFSSDG